MTRLTDQLVFRKSSYSAERQCVEVAGARGTVVIRDSKRPEALTLVLSISGFSALVRSL